MTLKLAVIISCMFLASARSQYMDRLQDSTVRMYSNTVLGLSFQYHPDYEFFDDSYPIPRKQWHRSTEKLLGLSFLSPKPYEMQWSRRDFWLWRPATDSVLTLYFGQGVTVQIYRTTMSLPEIAFAEGFQQYQNDSSEALPRFELDSLPEHVSDTSWVLVGISGLPYEAQPLNGFLWSGLRGQSDTRASLPEQSTTYIAQVFISFLACTSHSGSNIVFVFRQDPDDNESIPGAKQPQRLSEAGFYDLVASVKCIKKR